MANGTGTFRIGEARTVRTATDETETWDPLYISPEAGPSGRAVSPVAGTDLLEPLPDAFGVGL